MAGDSGAPAHVGKGSVAVVVVERIARAGQATRAALHGDAFVLARAALAELGQVVDVEVNVVCDEEVEPSVVVVVNEGRAR